jgi:hypothetical protein
MITWQRLLFILGLAVVEATPAALLLTIAGGGAWLLLVGLVLAAALADWLIQGWLAPGQQRPALLVAGALLALWMVKGLAVGDYGLGGWGQALSALFSFEHPRNGFAYLTLLCSLYTFWRGSLLPAHDSFTLRQTFGRLAAALLVLLGLGSLVLSSEAALLAATLQVLAFFAVGLLTLALSNASGENDTQLRRLDWRGLLILCGTIALVLGLGLVLLSLFGAEAAQLIGLFGRGVALLVALILTPFAILLLSFLEWLVNLLRLPELAESFQEMLQQQQQQQEQFGLLPDEQAPALLGTILQIFLAVLPILVLAALILLARRYARRPVRTDEERESLWSWGGLAADLRDLFARLRNPFGGVEGLRAALARLRGADPVSRIRRSYIRLLLAGEAHERPRTPPQTPREYEPTADTIIPAAARPIAALTEAYERARYHPGATTSADADAAEQAWSEIDAADRRPPTADRRK